jgi:hypothetical protein
MTSLDDPGSGLGLTSCSSCGRMIDSVCIVCGPLPPGIQTQAPDARAVQPVSAKAHPKREQLEKGGWTFKQCERGWLAVNRLLDCALTRPTIDMLIETIVSGDVFR